MTTKISHPTNLFRLIPNMQTGEAKVSGNSTRIFSRARAHSLGAKTHRVAFLLSLNVAGAFDTISCQPLLHNLRRRRMPERITRVEKFLAGHAQHQPSIAKPGTSSREPYAYRRDHQSHLYYFYNADLLEPWGCVIALIRLSCFGIHRGRQHFSLLYQQRKLSGP